MIALSLCRAMGGPVIRIKEGVSTARDANLSGRAFEGVRACAVVAHTARAR